MKCYIATFFQYDNYGTRLQNFALCQAIRKMGAEPVTLAIDNKMEKKIRFVKDICAYMPNVSSRQLIWRSNRKKRLVFQRFNKELCLQKVKYKELDKLDFSDALVIAGSDQIWSPMHLAERKQEAELYFLRFAPEEKRYAYAPSFGEEDIPDKMKDMYRRYLNEFEQLSVRETAGQALIRNITDLEVPVLPDPVFLLNKEEWEIAINSSDIVIPEGNYIVVYFLSRQSENVWRKIKSAAKLKNARIISISGNYYKKGELVPAPDAFIKLIDGAQAVFTDSFHGSAFSIIMQTPFLVFRRKDVEQFSRLDMLLDKYECRNVFVDNENQRDYDKMLCRSTTDKEKIMQAERQKGLTYIERIIRLNDKQGRREKICLNSK